MKTKAKTPSGVKQTGKVFKQGKYKYFYKKVRASKHAFRMVPSFGCDIAIIEGMPEDVGFLRVFEIEEGKNYYAAISVMKKRNFVVDFGYGEQYMLPMEFWKPTLEEAIDFEEWIRVNTK